ncbi:MAG: hypothetical protein ACREQ4_12315 [Candidatus Binataceae bacterium]
MLEDTSTPVVVLVCHHHVGVGIMRSLGRLGVSVYGIDADRFSPAFFSRYCRGKFIWDLHKITAAEALKRLDEVNRSIGRRALLIPTSDIGTMLVAEHASELADKFIFRELDADTVRSLCSKKEMYYLARKCDVPVPETAFPESRADVLRYLETARFPILLKPIYPQVPGNKTKKWRMEIVTGRAHLLERYDAVEDHDTPNVMLQEYVAGGDEMTWTFNGYFDRDGECRVAFTGRKLRNFPAYFGQASLAVCQRNDYVQDTTIRFMKEIGYRGPLDLGYRYDARDGRYKVNDINPRIGAMFRLFVDPNGVDVARAFYEDMTGQPVTPAAPAPEGRKWIVEDVDLFSSIRYWRDGKLTLRDWRRSRRGIQERAFLARDDPFPLAGAYLMDVKRSLSNRFGKEQENARGETSAAQAPVIAQVNSNSHQSVTEGHEHARNGRAADHTAERIA